MKQDREQRVIFIDDDTEFIDMISGVIHHPHFQIDTFLARDGYQAVQEVIKARPDVLFIDFALPRANAGEILPMLKSAPELSDLHIYFVTGYPTEEVFPFLRGLDFDGLLVKGRTMDSEIIGILNKLDGNL